MTERARLYLLILALIIAQGGGLAVAFIAIVVNQREAQREQCELVRVYDEAYRADPPTSPTGRGIADATARYLERRCR